MPRMKIQRIINKEKRKEKNPDNHNFQDVENSGVSNIENCIKVDGKGKPDKNAGKNNDNLKKKDDQDQNKLIDIEDSAFEKPKTETL